MEMARSPYKGKTALPTIEEAGPEPIVCVPNLLHTLADSVEEARVLNGKPAGEVTYAGSVPLSQAIPILIAGLETVYHHMMLLDKALADALSAHNEGPADEALGLTDLYCDEPSSTLPMDESDVLDC